MTGHDLCHFCNTHGDGTSNYGSPDDGDGEDEEIC